MVTCSDLVKYTDGELESPHDDAFRDHLADCAACRAKLHSEVQLRQRLEALGSGAMIAPSSDDTLVETLRLHRVQRRVYMLLLLNTVLPIIFRSTVWMWIGLAANAVCWCLALAVLSAEIRHLRRTLNPTQEAPSQSTTNNQRTA